MLPAMTPRTEELAARITAFMDEHIYPAEPVFQRQIESAADRWDELPGMAELKAKAKAAGLWNLFLPKRHYPDALSNFEYAPLCEIMGRSPIGPEPFNCSAPDTGNMETLILYGTEEQKRRWLKPLMDGEIRSCFAMTEPAVASSDATNIRAEIRRDGDHYIINGRKWWTSGAMDRRCEIAIVMGLTDPGAEPHRRQSMVLVPLDTPGVKVERALSIFGYDDAPHGLRPRHRGPRRDAPLDCGVPHRDRPGAPLDAARRPHDGHGGQQGRPGRDCHDQGSGPQRGPESHRPRHPGLRRRWRQPRFSPGLCLCAHPRAAPCRRPRRGPPRDRGQAGAAQISLASQSAAP